MLSIRGIVLTRTRWYSAIWSLDTTPNLLYSTSVETSGTERVNEPKEKPRSLLAKQGLIDPRTGERRQGTNWDYKCELSAFAHRIGFSPEELPSLLQALTPVPLPHDGDSGSMQTDQLEVIDNSRLATLGMTAIHHYVTEYAYCTYKHLGGGSLKALRSAVIDPDILCSVADHLGVVDLIRTAQCLYNPLQTKLISQSLAAVIGAAYVDKSPFAARGLVHDFLITQLASKDINNVIRFHRPKATLVELLKRTGQSPPQSRLIRESGRATHFPTFVVGVFSGDRQLGEGAGSSLKRAENEALTAALRLYFQEEMKAGPLPSDLEEYQDEKDIDIFWRNKDEDVKNTDTNQSSLYS